jgi:hypothetical protein
VSLTNPQRLDFMRLVSDYSGRRGLTSVQGFANTPAGRVRVPEYEERRIAATPYLTDSVPRHRYLLDMCRHKVVVAPTGYGEVTIRHAEAMAAGAAVVCQDLSHAETMFPFRHRENVVFCRPDLCNLRSTLDELLSDKLMHTRIARRGRQEFIEWSRQWRRHLFTGIELPVRMALGGEAPQL